MTREKQLQQLLAVCLFAYLPAIIYSFYLLITGTNNDSDSNSAGSFTFSIIHMVLALSLLAKVMSSRGSSYQDLGIVISWRYALGGLALAVLAYIVHSLAQGMLASILPKASEDLLVPKNVGDITGKFSVLLLLLLVVNPFCEELIVRGFLMTEVFSLTESKTAAIAISVLFQTSYHLYQGLLPALLTGLVFLLFSLFYSKTGNLTTVIVAHLIMDLALLVH